MRVVFLVGSSNYTWPNIYATIMILSRWLPLFLSLSLPHWTLNCECIKMPWLTCLESCSKYVNATVATVLHSSHQRQTAVDNWQLQQLMTTTTSAAASATVTAATTTRQRQATGNNTQMLHDARQMQMRHALRVGDSDRKGRGAASQPRCSTLRRRTARIPMPRKKVATSWAPAKRRQLAICANCQNNVVKHKRSLRLRHLHCAPPLCLNSSRYSSLNSCLYFSLYSSVYSSVFSSVYSSLHFSVCSSLHTFHYFSLHFSLYSVLHSSPTTVCTLHVFLSVLLHILLSLLLSALLPVLFTVSPSVLISWLLCTSLLTFPCTFPRAPHCRPFKTPVYTSPCTLLSVFLAVLI